MTVLTHEIQIDVPPERVWPVLADLEAVQHYNPGVARARYITGQREGIGASRQCDLRPKGWVKERVIGWEPNQAVTLELYESQWPVEFMRWRTAVRPESAGTRVTQRMEYRLKFGVLGRLMDVLIMRRKLDRTISEIFASLKRYIESPSGASAR